MSYIYSKNSGSFISWCYDWAW